MLRIPSLGLFFLARKREYINKTTTILKGCMIALKDDLAAKQTQKYTGDQELEKVTLNETQDMDGKVKDLAMKAGLISLFLLIACIVIYWIKERK